ncbi:MAG: sigma-54-dependent Fis family transcriptional regulator [Gammaproteobacteria bacterium MedPE]|nr:MAG: sigma-54-dependent Fis family transcriptional regulator [Gammaproteobacteria bacterium MedPE]
MLANIKCTSVLTPAEGLAKLSQQSFDLVIQDMNFTNDMTSGDEGIALFHQIREIASDMPIIVITAWTHLETAVDLVRCGFADYLAKPWDDDKMLNAINNLLELGELTYAHRNIATKRQQRINVLNAKFDLCDLQFQSDEMLSLLELTTKVAHADVPVLITGPNGAGKEKIAQIIQRNSSVSQGPFVKVNVGALPKDLMEAELFGAEAGAFTGATKTRIGRFERANNGTLFLDEIGNLSLDGQAKLLRVLETGELERIGGSETITVNVRVVSATNADLAQAIIDGEFREDLFYRLNVIELNLMALNQRQDDIIPLANFFLQAPYKLTVAAADKLNQYHWPGNVRELQNIIKRAMLICNETVIDASDIDVKVVEKMNGKDFAEPDLEMINAALATHNGVVSAAAKQLGLSRSALYRRMKKFEIESQN